MEELSEIRNRIATPDEILKKITPGMNIFIGTGVAEPRTLVKHLMKSGAENLRDLELSQLVSLGDAIAVNELHHRKYRLKTFFSGWESDEAITEGLADLIPSRYYEIPRVIESRRIPIDAAFVQITPPDDAGYCSLGLSIDVARQAMEQASLVVGEINRLIPRTYGDTLAHISDFDLFTEAADPPIYFDRWPVDEIYDQIGANVAGVIEDGSCIAFSIGPLFEALSRHLVHKRHLGIHTPFFFDNLMELVKSGAVTNRYKDIYRGKSLTAYAIGTPALYKWLDKNPLVEFQGIDKVFNPMKIALNPRFVAVLPARKVDLSGRIALHTGKGNVGTGPGEVLDFFYGALFSRGGRTIFALPSRNREGKSNILTSVKNFPNQFGMWDAVHMLATEYGVISLKGRTVRERAQALIDIAHPDDRAELVGLAKERHILYPDQIFLPETGHLYPAEIAVGETFRNGLAVRFRAIRPSDEEEMRRLFYRFSEQAVYYRYFTQYRTMPHCRIQEYVNADYRRVLSVVGLIGEPGQGRIIAEGRFVRAQDSTYAEIACTVDDAYQRMGIGTFLYKLLIRLAKERGISGFTGEVLMQNRGIMKVLEKGDVPVRAELKHGIYHLTIPFGDADAGA
ncbi:GCN5 family acetyltransferase [Desulfonema ishimotonii]|uniref:GCN5 family acetyltransferase n=1 Tax=Desulfonema ishimotonii TaxID=45657 RepID=A0A401FW39_9BACT|nr:GNAT family N-acetyltransferase [Desulfonema ishimotonii]GBC61187.1 GCN5 family acetyltransferase [Desulfonema ishimotonii]